MKYQTIYSFVESKTPDQEYDLIHLKTALQQLGESNTSPKRVVKYLARLGMSLNESIPFDDSMALIEKSIDLGIDLPILEMCYLRDPENGISRVESLINRALSEAKVTVTVTDDEKTDYEKELEKLDNKEELTKIANEVDSWDDISHHYDASDFVMKIEEHLSKEERLKRKVSFAKSEAKREVAKKMALKRLSSAPKIKQKARKQAIQMLKERIAKKPLDQLSVAEKERLEDVIIKRKDLITRLANKIAPKIRKLEQERLHKKGLKEEAGPKGERANSEDKEEELVVDAAGNVVEKEHSPEAVFDDGGVDDENYVAQ